MIKEMTVEEFWQRPEALPILMAYEAESLLAGLPPTNPDHCLYNALHAAGALRLLGAFVGEEMIGFATVIISPVARYSAKLAVTESLYVFPEHRGGGAGWKLIRRAEVIAAESGAIGFFISTPVGSSFEKTMDGAKGYVRSNAVFFKRTDAGHDEGGCEEIQGPPPTPAEIAFRDVSQAVGVPVKWPRTSQEGRGMTTELSTHMTLPSMTAEEVAKADALAEEFLKTKQIDIGTEHHFHAGVYTRAVFLRKNVRIVGALIKIPTIVVVSGDVLVYTGENVVRLTGFHTLEAQAWRKQVFVALADTHILMTFATTAQDVDTAEREFTDEFDKLLSRRV